MKKIGYKRLLDSLTTAYGGFRLHDDATLSLELGTERRLSNRTFLRANTNLGLKKRQIN
jgi:hypothetical protein